MATPAVIIHSLEHVRAALAAAEETGMVVALFSAPGAGAYAGAGWFLAVLSEAAAAHPLAEYQAALDCAGDAGAALAGLRAGCKAIVFDGPPALRRKLAAIAAAKEARLVKRPEQALDLHHAAEPQASVREWLARRGGEE